MENSDDLTFNILSEFESNDDVVGVIVVIIDVAADEPEPNFLHR